MTEMQENLPAPASKGAVAPITYGGRGIQLQSFEDLYRFASVVLESGFAPVSFKKPAQVMAAIQHGAELGVSPMQALSGIFIIGNKPSLMVELAMAIVNASGKLAVKEEKWDGEGDERRAVVVLRRTDGQRCERTFSIADAKRAGLGGKDTWKGYPDRMLFARALGFALRDLFPDVLRGIGIAEEQADIPREARNITPLQSRPAPAGPDPLLAQLGSGRAETVEVPPQAELEPVVVESEVEPVSGFDSREGPPGDPVAASDSSPIALSAPIQAAIKQRIKMLGLTKSGEKVAAQRMESMAVDMLDLADLKDESEILAAIRSWKMQ